MAEVLFDPSRLLVLTEPKNHLNIATKEMLVTALSNRVLELTPEGVHQYGGGYTEYVARTGQEAPGLHPQG